MEEGVEMAPSTVCLQPVQLILASGTASRGVLVRGAEAEGHGPAPAVERALEIRSDQIQSAAHFEGLVALLGQQRDGLFQVRLGLVRLALLQQCEA